MSKLPIALIAVVVTSGLAAQTAPPAPTPNERRQTVRSTTEAAAASTTGAQTARQQSANVQQSKQVARLSKEENTKLAKDTTKVEPESRELLGPGGDVLHARTDGGAVEGGIATKHRAQHEAGTATARERTSAKVDSVDRMRICHQSLDESNGERYA